MLKTIIRVIIGTFILLAIGAGMYIYYGIEPKLALNGQEYISVYVGDTYEEEGWIAKFLRKDVSKHVKVTGTIDTNKTGTYRLTYKLKLKYNNKEVTKIRTIVVVDKDSPKIDLNGNYNIEINQGDNYTEPGYVATDEYDGNLTSKVETSGIVDTKTPGEYKVIYKVQDSSGNKFEVSRNIHVKQTTTTTTTTTTKKKTTTTKDPNKDGDTSKVTTKKGTGEGVPILMYHYFYDEEAGETGADSNWMEIHDFEKQLKYLSDNNYYYPTWQELRDFVDGKITLPSKSVIITMDDGHKSVFNLALPLLEKYKVKATSFIITSKPSAKNVKKYANHEYLEFQSHTHNMHQGGCSGGHGGLFRCINYDKGLADLQSSIDYLGTNDALAYPYGDVTANVLKITKAAKFKVGVTTKWGYAKKGADPYQLPRIRMYKGIALSTFKSNVK